MITRQATKSQHCWYNDRRHDSHARNLKEWMMKHDDDQPDHHHGTVDHAVSKMG